MEPASFNVDYGVVLGVIALTLTVIQFIYRFHMDRSEVSKNELTELENTLENVRMNHSKRIGDVEGRVTRTAERNEHLPDSDDIGGVKKMLSDLNGDFREFRGEFCRVRGRVERMDDFLRQAGSQSGGGK